MGFIERNVKKNRGILLAEAVIFISIIFTLTFFIYTKYRSINEQRDIEKAVNIFETIVYKYSSKSLRDKKIYDFEINYNTKTVKVLGMEITGGKNQVIEEFKLPEKLNYATPYDNKLIDIVKMNSTLHGNLSKSFSIYIFGYSNTVKYRTAFYIYQQNKLLKINLYRNISAGKIKYEDILDYHYERDENAVGAGWKKE